MLAAVVLGSVLARGDLRWEAPASCPDAAFVDARLQSYLGDDVEFTATARVVELADGHEATVEVAAAGGTNTRTLRGTDCTTVADAVALVIAVDVDVLAVANHAGVRIVLEGELPEPPEPPPTIPEPSPPAEAVPPPEPMQPRVASSTASPPPQSNDLGFALRLDAGLGVGALPQANFVAGLTAAIRWRRWRWELSGAHHFERPARLEPPNEGAGANVWLWAGSVRARFVPSVKSVEFPLGLGVELGDMIGDGAGVMNSQRRHGLWGAGLLGAALVVVPHPRIGLWLDPALVLAFARPGFGVGTLQGRQVAHQPGVPGFRATLGLEVRID
jgi:hypothetical protein